jgi:circadian clock protein KaiC
VNHNSVVRKLQVVKMRGQGQIPGLHTARISGDGFRVFPRLLKPPETIPESPLENRVSTGVPGLDELFGGGIPRGYSVLVAGPSGSGKTILTNQFLAEGARLGESGIVAVFERRPVGWCWSRRRTTGGRRGSTSRRCRSGASATRSWRRTGRPSGASCCWPAR